MNKKDYKKPYKKKGNKFSQIFQTPQGRWSSKRFFGGLGWIVVLGVLIWCTYEHTEAPEITEIVCIVSAALMGLGVVEPFFRSKKYIVKKAASQSEEDEADPE